MRYIRTKEYVVDMEQEVKQKNKVLYVWGECGLTYKERIWAEKCEIFRAMHHTCSLEIIKHAVQID